MSKIFKSVITIFLAGFLLGTSVLGVLAARSNTRLDTTQALIPVQVQVDNGDTVLDSGLKSDSLIRFHVIANSDNDSDQALKRAVRDAILEKVSPRLAESHSINESREILKNLLPEMESIAGDVVKSWGENYPVQAEYGKTEFPTKSYGSLVLPAGEYEAVRILIGNAEGANWWCVLFPPLCFVDIEHSTAVPVDGKPGIPLKKSQPEEKVKSPEKDKPVIRFWFWEKLKGVMDKEG